MSVLFGRHLGGMGECCILFPSVSGQYRGGISGISLAKIPNDCSNSRRGGGLRKFFRLSKGRGQGQRQLPLRLFPKSRCYSVPRRVFCIDSYSFLYGFPSVKARLGKSIEDCFVFASFHVAHLQPKEKVPPKRHSQSVSVSHLAKSRSSIFSAASSSMQGSTWV